jgi:hypothetical protein
MKTAFLILPLLALLGVALWAGVDGFLRQGERSAAQRQGEQRG